MRFKALAAWLSVPVLMVLSFSAMAFASGATTTDEGSLLDMARPIFDAVMHGQWWLGAALALVFACAAIRKYLPDSWGGKFARSDFGGMLTAFGMSFGGAAATAFAAMGTAVSFAMVPGVAFMALKVAIFAVGGYKAIHELGKWVTSTAWYQTKAPAIVKTIVSFVLSMIGSSAIAKAEAAGKAAVEAKPAPGAASVVGEGTDL